MIQHGRDDEIERLLDQPAVDARLELTSWLGGKRLADLHPGAGKLAWNETDRRGSLDVDVAVEQRIMSPSHPLANVGQVLEARWTWPEINVSIPCGRWLISEPASREGPVWQVAADPEGPARLARAQLWEPGAHVIKGTVMGQLRQLLLHANVSGVHMESWLDKSAPDTEADAGTSVLSLVEDLLAHGETIMRAGRDGLGVEFHRHMYGSGSYQWRLSTSSPRVLKVSGDIATDEIPNRITVWCEEEVETGDEANPTQHVTRGFSQPLYEGPRRWGGPYGQVPKVVRLDAPVPDIELRQRARHLLREAQEKAATVRVEMRADPRIEVGDSMQVVDPTTATDCYGRVTSVELDAATGVGVVQCSVRYGRLAGEPISILNQN